MKRPRGFTRIEPFAPSTLLRDSVRLRVPLERRPFTLVELLVVIAIIAVLVAILLPSLQRAKLVAKAATCCMQERSIALAMAQYCQDWNGFVPVHCHGTWRGDLYPYLADPSARVFFCPASKLKAWLYAPPDLRSVNSMNEGTYGQFYTLNAYNYSRFVPEAVPPRTCQDNGNVRWWPITRGWKGPSASVYCADTALGPPGYPTVETGGTNHVTAWEIGTISYLTSSSTRRFADRHLGTNCVFVDGHVQRYSTAWLDSIPSSDAQCIWNTR